MAALQTLNLKNGSIINASDYDESQHDLASGQKAPQKDSNKLGPNERRVILQAERAPSDVPTSDAIRVNASVPVMKVRLHSSGEDVVINRAEFNPSLHTVLLDDPVTRASSFTPSATDPLRAAGTGVVARNVGSFGGTEVPIDSAAERAQRATASNRAAMDAGESHYNAADDAAAASRESAAALSTSGGSAALEPAKSDAKRAGAPKAGQKAGQKAPKAGQPSAKRKAAK